MSMSKKQTMKIIRNYKQTKPKSAFRLKYLHSFEPKMIFRTTKTENPETSFLNVKKVLRIGR